MSKPMHQSHGLAQSTPTHLRTLSNGSLVHAEYLMAPSEGARPSTIVLGQTANEYATWICLDPGTAREDCIWGHYFGEDWQSALEDFSKRILQ